MKINLKKYILGLKEFFHDETIQIMEKFYEEKNIMMKQIFMINNLF